MALCSTASFESIPLRSVDDGDRDDDDGVHGHGDVHGDQMRRFRGSRKVSTEWKAKKVRSPPALVILHRLYSWLMWLEFVAATAVVRDRQRGPCSLSEADSI